MNDEIKSMLKDAGIIVAITLIAGLVLGGVYQLTKEPIEEQKRIKKANACKEVYAEAASFTEMADFDTVFQGLAIANRIRKPQHPCLPQSIPLRISMR